jgi:cytochrome b subunit of formate dehydrogenase
MCGGSVQISIDPLGFAIVLIAIVLALHTTRISFQIYNDFGTEFFKYTTIAFFCVTLMISGYIFPAVFGEESMQWLVLAGQVTLTSFGLLAIALVIYAQKKFNGNQSSTWRFFFQG